jgi:hypothetical protein
VLWVETSKGGVSLTCLALWEAVQSDMLSAPVIVSSLVSNAACSAVIVRQLLWHSSEAGCRHSVACVLWSETHFQQADVKRNTPVGFQTFSFTAERWSQDLINWRKSRLRIAESFLWSRYALGLRTNSALLGNLKVHYRVHKRPPLAPIVSYSNLLRTHTRCLRSTLILSSFLMLNAAVGFDVLTTCQPSTVWCSRERLSAAAAQQAKFRQSL